MYSPSMKTRSTLVAVAATLQASLGLCPDGCASPNVVLILADDLGYADVGFNGCQDIPTPHIDKIASRGVRCTNGYAPHPFCSPSRAGILAGRYQHRFGHENNPIFAPDDPNMGMPLEQKTMADALGAADYHCGVIGKWHLGAHESFHPLNRGFDSFYGMLGGGHVYFPEKLTIDRPTKHKHGYHTRLMRDRRRVDEAEYLTDAFSREAVDFIGRNSTEPFFLFLSYNAPHAPLQATDEYLARFQHIADGRRRTYAAMVSAVDDGVGRVLEALADEGVLEDTILVFMSDNGGPTAANASDNRPLRGFKGGPYEGGVRVPFAVRWDAVLPSGVDYHQPVSGLDIFATAAAAAGARPQADQPLDGVDLVPFLTGSATGPPHEALYWRLAGGSWKGKTVNGARIIRRGALKLIRHGNDQEELYDLFEDIRESTDLRAQLRGNAQELSSSIDSWDKEMVEPRFLGLRRHDEYRQMRQDNQIPLDRL